CCSRVLLSFPTRRSSDLVVPAQWMVAVVVRFDPKQHWEQDLPSWNTRPTVGPLQWSRSSRPGCLTPALTRLPFLLLLWSPRPVRSEEHTSELQSLRHLVC